MLTIDHSFAFQRLKQKSIRSIKVLKFVCHDPQSTRSLSRGRGSSLFAWVYGYLRVDAKQTTSTHRQNGCATYTNHLTAQCELRQNRCTVDNKISRGPFDGCCTSSADPLVASRASVMWLNRTLSAAMLAFSRAMSSDRESLAACPEPSSASADWSFATAADASSACRLDEGGNRGVARYRFPDYKSLKGRMVLDESGS